MISTREGSGLVTRLSIVSSNRSTEVTMIEGNQVRNSILNGVMNIHISMLPSIMIIFTHQSR